MTTVTIEIESRQVIGYLQQAPVRINRAMRAAMEDATVLIHRQMQTYPPQRAGSTYKRTNTLRASWFRPPISGQGNEIVGEVVSSGNTAPYNRLVQDADRQAAVHRGRWTNTAQEVQRRTTPTIQRYFDRRLREEFGR
jgi:hypothetical protein